VNQFLYHLVHHAQSIRINIAESKFTAIRPGNHQHISAEVRTKPRAGAHEGDIDRPMNPPAQPLLRVCGFGVSSVAGFGFIDLTHIDVAPSMNADSVIHLSMA
jgi:hypothetical protein